MATRLSLYCERVIEGGWLAAAVALPLYFNTASSRLFEPDKICVFRSIALVMVLAWLIIGCERLFMRLNGTPSEDGNADDNDPRGKDPEGDASPWSVHAAWPFLLPAAMALISFVLSTVFSIKPDVSVWGSYARLQGLYTFLSYLVVFVSAMVLLRTRARIERLITVALMSSVPVVLYGMLQHLSLDPLPWGQEGVRRVISTQGNAVFLSAYLIMLIPLALYRLWRSVDAATAKEGGGVRRLLIGAITVNVVLLVAAWGRGHVSGVLAILVTLGFWVGQAHLLSQPKMAFCRVGLNIVLLGLQLACVWFTRSRGPWMGLLTGVFFMGLIWLLVQRRRVGALLVSGGALAAAALLVALIVPGSPLNEALRDTGAGRLGEVFKRSGRVRLLIWEGVQDMVADNPSRAAVGYGPETMHLAFFPYYPSELGRIERQNASADRSHNETFDALVSTGVVGLFVHIWLFTVALLFGLRRLGLIECRRQGIHFLFWWLCGGLAAVFLARGVDPSQSWRLAGVVFPIGQVAGLFAYLSLRAFSGFRGSLVGSDQTDAKEKTDPEGSGHATAWVEDRNLVRLLLMCLLGAIIAHYVEIDFGISTVTTKYLFWIFFALIWVLVHVREQKTQTVESEQEEPSKRKRGKKKLQKVARSTADWPAISVFAGLICVTLTSQFVAPIWHTTIRPWLNGHATLATGVPQLLLLILFSWLICGLVVFLEHVELAPTDTRLRDLLAVFGGFLAATLLPVFLYAMMRTMGLGEPHLESEIWVPPYYACVLAILVVAGGLLLRDRTVEPRRGPIWPALAYPLLFAGTLLCIHVTNVRPVEADIWHRRSILKSYTKRDPDSAVVMLERAVERAPGQDHYLPFLAEALVRSALKTPDVSLRESRMQKAKARFEEALALNPLSPDHRINLARWYASAIKTARDAETRRTHAEQVKAWYKKAVEMQPKRVQWCNEWAGYHMRRGEWRSALETLNRALEIDDAYHETYEVLGELYTRRGQFEKARDAYERASKCDPRAFRARFSLSRLHARLNRPEDAKHWMSAAEESAAIQLNGLFRLARLCESVGEHDTALRLATRAAEQASEYEKRKLKAFTERLMKRAPREANP